MMLKSKYRPFKSQSIEVIIVVYILPFDSGILRGNQIHILFVYSLVVNEGLGIHWNLAHPLPTLNQALIQHRHSIEY